jgi:hypothetical protein
MKMKTFIKIFFLLGLVIILSACQLPFLNNLRGSGEVISETRNVRDFSEIQLDGAGTLIITQGSSESLEIQAEENIISELTSEVEGNVLILGFEEDLWRRRVIPTKGIVYTLTVIDLEKITFNGFGNLEIDKLETPAFEITINGAGKIQVDQLTTQNLQVAIIGTGTVEVTGEAATQSINIDGAGSYIAPDLRSQSTSIEIDGLGEGKVWAEETLYISIDGGGNVDYYGSPIVSQDINGLGEIHNLGEK